MLRLKCSSFEIKSVSFFLSIGNALIDRDLFHQKSTLQTSNDTTAAQLLEVRNELVQLSSDRSAFVITKSTLEADLKILQDAAMNHGIEVKTLKEELRNVTAKNEEWKVETKKIAYRECLAGNERAQGLLQVRSIDALLSIGCTRSRWSGADIVWNNDRTISNERTTRISNWRGSFYDRRERLLKQSEYRM